jgi:phage gpG-like protein
MQHRVREILLKRLREADISRVLVKQAQARIKSKGSDVGGYADLWADSAKITIGKGKRRREISHYRKGGTPLYDTGNLFRSLSSKMTAIGDGVRLTLLAPLYGLYQHHGFTTSGPNFIPFTRAAARKDSKAIKRHEYAYARSGVTVPARPIFALPNTARAELARTIARALGAR